MRYLKFLFLLNVFSLYGEALPYENMDIFHPTREDCLKIQDYLFNGKRPYLKWVGKALWQTDDAAGRYPRIRGIRYFHPDYEPEFEILSFGDPQKGKDQCIISYATYNESYAPLQKLLIKSLKRSPINGDILVRLGGWPDIEGGSLKLAHVPHSFKPAFFREAQRLGYKRVLWIDTGLVVEKDLQPIFDIIKKNGYFVTEFPFSPRSQLYNEKVLNYFNISKKKMNKPPLCWTAIVGLDLTHPTGREILNRWYSAAEALDPFLNIVVDQTPFSFILYQLGLKSICHRDKIVSPNQGPAKPGHFFSTIRYGYRPDWLIFDYSAD